jgi:hypothetical protein
VVRRWIDDVGGVHVLIVGAGALGQVYGRHLALAGDEVTFLVKEKYAEEARAGFSMLQLSAGGARRPARFEGFGVITEVGEARFDEVWLAISSDALAGAWLDELLAAIGSATLVVLQPGIEQRELILSKSQGDRVVFGLPSIVSYHAPLGDEPDEGTTYLLPPLAKSAFSGPGAAAIVRRLRAGGMPATRVRDAVWAGTVPTAALITHVAALELAGWSFARARRGDLLAQAARAAREAMVIAARHLRRRAPLVRFFVRPWLVKIAGFFGRRFAPFDLEAYLRVHFKKTAPQTRLLLDSFIARGRDEGVSVAALDRLRRALPPL